jgi:GntR family transcriptional regulator/MocR family aminotransferase
MSIQIDKEKRPAYLQIYKQMRDDIIAGNYPYNTKLPSKRSLAEKTGVSTITVEHAYALLCDEGYALAKERSGFVVTFRKADGFASSKEQQTNYIPKTSQQNIPSFPLSVLSKTMRKVLTEHGELLLEKSPNSGCVELKEAICRYLARNRGIHVTPQQIVIGSGSEYLYNLIVGVLGKNKRYGIESPSYKKIEQVYQSAGIPYTLLPLTSEGIDSLALTTTNANVLHTTPYRSYPSGVTATASKRHEYIDWSAQNGRYIIEDDYESEFSVSAKPTETLFALSPHDNVIYLNTFSQTISPSLRIGYMVLPNHLVNQFEKQLGFYSCTVSTFMQYLVAELINNGDFERHINRVRRKKRKELSQ